ncbi:glycosyl hydrolase family 18 protein [Kitasatospora sp. NBC_01300]|uniref:glycosyl hydrolase family 18 protein n=1 Tax=Kitasatospora sp. NBC_01300 TaxID=2903574 RepID=UPI002F90FAAF|nr:glycosyl hydrolase family 18 protein [Kitasatospora sp. NBC_01300]
MAVFLAFTSMSMLSAPPASASTEDTVYAARYLKFIDEVRANATLPLLDAQAAAEHDVRQAQEGTEGFVEIPLTWLEELDPTTDRQPASLYVRRSDLYIVGFLRPAMGDERQGRFFRFREVRGLTAPEGYEEVDLGYNDRYNDANGLDDQNTVTINRSDLQIAAEALRTARNNHDYRQYLRGHLLRLAVGVAEAARFQPIRDGIYRALANGGTWHANETVWRDNETVPDAVRQVVTGGWLTNHWNDLSRFVTAWMRTPGADLETPYDGGVLDTALRGVPFTIGKVLVILATVHVEAAAVPGPGCRRPFQLGSDAASAGPDTCTARYKPIDAAVSVSDSRGTVILFKGPSFQYMIGSRDWPWALDGKPSSIVQACPALRGTDFALGVDAALRLPDYPDDLLLFRGDQYLRLRLGTGAFGRKTLEGCSAVTKPAAIGDAFKPLKGTVFANGVDTAVSVTGSQVYFFKGDQYALVQVDLGGTGDRIVNGPKTIADNWSALKAAGFFRDLDAAFSVPRPVGGSSSSSTETVFIKNGAFVSMEVHPGTVDDDYISAGMIDDDWYYFRNSLFSAGNGATRIPDSMHRPSKGLAPGPIKGLAGKCLDVKDGSRDNGTPVRLQDCKGGDAQTWSVPGDSTVQALGLCLDADHSGKDYGTKVQLWGCNGSDAQKWTRTAARELKNVNAGLCLDVPGSVSDDGRQLQLYGCNGSDAQKWVLNDPSGTDRPTPVNGDAGSPFDDSADDRGTKPATSGDCRPEGMTPTAGVAARYCDVYDNAGREWVGNNRTRRTVGYFTGWRTGTKGDPTYLASNIPWSKVTHVNYAFARVEDNRISVGDVNDPKNPATGMTWDGDRNAMDPSLPYKGHFNLLNTYKKKHPAVKTLISVGGWADTRNFYAMATNADGSVNQAGIDAFADSVTDFLDRYGFNGVDIDYEYPTALPSTGNPNDWDVSNPRRKGLQQGYTSLMKTLRTKLDQSGTAKGRYYLLTSAGSASGYLVRGLDAGQALQYQDYVNVMSYDLHGSWNKYVGPQAPLHDDGRDNELADAGIYNDQAPDTKDYQKNGYFNVDWAYHYYRGALPPGRINLGIPYYSRGWQSVQGGTDGLWGTSAMPDQSKCPLGVGGRGPANGQDCGLGATGIDNVWHDTEDGREVGAGSNPLWHTKNLQDGRTPGYLKSYGVDPATDAGRLTGSYAEKYSDPLQSSWLWNDSRKVFLSTENEKSIDAKVKYIADKGVGGAMIWELAGDYTKRSNGEWGMGYDLTTRLDNALKGAGAYGNTTGGGKPLPSQVIDVKAELVDFPTDVGDMWPIQPKLRITNNSKVALVQGTEISFDLPTSAPPVVKDGAWKEMSGIVPGHTGPNAGGLKGDFHRVTIKLGYCEDVPAGRSKDIDVKYYLPITGPANVTFRIAGKDFGSTGDRRRAVTTVDPPAVSGTGQCQAAPWQAHAYNPNPSFAFWQTGDKWIIEDRNSGNVLDHPGSWTDAHLSMKQTGNANQLWTVSEDDQGWYHIKSATSGHDQCLGATTARGTLTVRDCDGKVDQWWRLVPLSTDQATAGKPMLDRWVTGGAKHGSSYALGSFADGTDWWKTPAYLAAPANSATASSTKIIAGDTDGAWASTVSWNGFYWRAKWWNKATDEPGRSDAWQKLGPTP